MDWQQQNSAAIMAQIDRLPPAFRALVHDYGFKIVTAMIDDGYRDAGEVRELLEQHRRRRQEQWLATDYITRAQTQRDS